MIIDAHQTMAASGTVHFNIEELTHLIETELSKLGFDRSMILVLDPQHNLIFRYILGFSEHQFQFYADNMDLDPYTPFYHGNGMIGSNVYLQELLPHSKVKDKRFHDLLLPTMEIEHSYIGIHPLSNNHLFVFGAFSETSPRLKQQLLATELITFLILWANGWIAQCAMERQWQKLSARTNGNSLVCALTQAEQAVLLMLTQGLDGSEIAQQRRVSKETVRSQIKQLLHKTGSKHQNQLISRYFYNQLTVC